jgi:16S rRNA (guanine966-N2)-methyltransferase
MALGAARYLNGPPQAFDVVFLDPPFGEGLIQRFLPLLAAGSWLKSGGLLYVESERAAGEPPLPGGWQLARSKYAGEVGYHLLRHGVVTGNEKT